MEYNCTKRILPQIAAQFCPWLQSQEASLTTEQSKSESNDADTEINDADTEPTDTMAESNEDNQTLEPLTYKVLGDMFGLAKGPPTPEDGGLPSSWPQNAPPTAASHTPPVDCRARPSLR